MHTHTDTPKHTYTHPEAWVRAVLSILQELYFLDDAAKTAWEKAMDLLHKESGECFTSREENDGYTGKHLFIKADGG